MNLLVDASLQLGAVAHHEKELEPDEHWSKEDGLHKIVKKSRGTALENAVPKELEEPADDVNGQSAFECRVWVLKAQVISQGAPAHAKGAEKEAGKRLKKKVESGIRKGGHCTQVDIQIGNSEP